MEWTFLPGFPAAKEFCVSFPTPREFRQCLRETSIHTLLSDDVKSLPWNLGGRTIGAELLAEDGQVDVGELWRVIRAHARDHKGWTAPDGTRTFLDA